MTRVKAGEGQREDEKYSEKSEPSSVQFVKPQSLPLSVYQFWTASNFDSGLSCRIGFQCGVVFISHSIWNQQRVLDDE